VSTRVPAEEQRLSLRLLGPPEGSIGGRPLHFGTKKTLALLCYLAAEGRKHPRRELAELLWPESDKRHARMGLRSALARLKKTLGEEGALGQEVVRFLVIEGDLLELKPQGLRLDLKALEAALTLARTQTSPAGSSPDAVGHRELIDRLREERGLYRGEIMEGFSIEDAPEFELWLETERTKWRRIFGELCERLSRLQSEASQLDEAIATTRVWVRHAPLEEEAHQRLMELLSSTGESGEALLAYDNFLGASIRGYNVEPSARLQELAHRLHAEVRERASLGASLARSGDIPASPLSELDVPLVGRHEEFGALVSEYHAASEGDRGGETHVVAVLGEAGIGKTRLAEEFLLWAKSRGAEVLEGGAAEGGGLPYGPLVEAIRPRIESERAPDDLLEDVWLSELSRLLPELRERYPDLFPPTPGEALTAKGALFEAIARMVEALAFNAPVVLFLDDLHWADAATLDVLDYAGKRWTERGATVLLLIAARPEEAEAGSAVERWLSSLGRRLPVRNLTLDPLGNGDVEALLRRLVRAGAPSRPVGALEGVGGSNAAEPGLKGLGEWLALETEGQPFYLVETLKALLEDGKIRIRSRLEGGGVMSVEPLRAGSDVRGLLPHSIREVIRSRLSRLSPDASELLMAGAVLERGFGFETLVGVAGLGEAEGLKGLDELTERHLLREEVGGQEEEEPLFYRSPTYSFTHEKIRQVSYTEMGHARRRLLHRKAFELLEEGAPPAELACHALAGGLAEPAFGYSVVAGDQAVEVFAAQDAIEHYERARSLLAEEGVRTGGARQLVEPPIPELEHLYTQFGRAYEMADEWEKAEATYETMLALGRQLGGARLEVVAFNHLAILALPHQREVDLPKAKALLEEARGVAEEAGLKEALVETECNLADFMTLWAGEFEDAGPLARKALASARSRERPDLVARALLTLTRIEVLRGRFEQSAAYAEEGAAVSQELAQHPPPRGLVPSMGTGVTFLASWRAGTKIMAIQCLSMLAWARIFQGRLREGIEIAREALGISRELPEGAEMEPRLVLGIGLVEIGEYEEGLELCRRNTDLAREAQDQSWLWANLDNLGRAYEALLDLEEARKVHEEALELSRAQGPLYEVYSSMRLCGVAALSGDWEEAYAHAKRAHEGKTSLHILDGFYLHHQVEALLRGGDEGSAREEARRFANRAKVNERERVAYLCSRANLGEWEGDTQRAIDHLHEARTLAEKFGVPGELWQIQSRLGELHERRGEIEEAREAFARAEQTLRALAGKIRDEKLREAFLSALWVRSVLRHTN
jgi:DNA-binding SARP family transcriptional activator/tetratricopeptide (TPR) repeat protein